MNYENQIKLSKIYSALGLTICLHSYHISIWSKDKDRLERIAIYLRNRGHCVHPKIFKEEGYYIIKVY